MHGTRDTRKVRGLKGSFASYLLHTYIWNTIKTHHLQPDIIQSFEQALNHAFALSLLRTRNTIVSTLVGAHILGAGNARPTGKHHGAAQTSPT